jgi:hypothetical protein
LPNPPTNTQALDLQTISSKKLSNPEGALDLRKHLDNHGESH